MSAAARQRRYLARQRAGQRLFHPLLDEVEAECLVQALGYDTADMDASLAKVFGLLIEVTRHDAEFQNVLECLLKQRST